MLNVFKKLVILSIVGCIVGVMSVGGVLIYFSMSLPKISTLADYKPAINSRILSKDGVVLTEIGKENRDVVEIKDVPKRIIDAFLSAEDSGFYEHQGVDYLGVARAFLANIKAGKVVQGGSTITQQVAKSLLLSRERSITRKIKDFLLAQKIEKKFSKDEILFLYLNQVYLGGGYYGVKSAFKGYFDKRLDEATVAESALVAGLLVAPGRYSPYLHPEYAKKRQGYVLGRMYANKKITKEEYENALKEKIRYRLRKKETFKAGFYTDWVRRLVVDEVGEENFLTNGFTVQTTLNYQLQKEAEESIREGVKNIDKRQGYKGVLGNISPDKYYDYFKKFRKDYYEEKSKFFTLEENERVYELQFNEEKLDQVIEYSKNTNQLFFSKRYKAGYFEEDQLVDALVEGENYKAIVLGTDDRFRLIYASIAGVTGIIPYKYFRWVHERELVEERKYWPYLKQPSRFFKPGDIINVKLVDKKTTFIKESYDIKYEDFKKFKDYETLNEQNYLELALDQEVDVEAALVSIDPFTGEIVSMVGGVDFEKSKFNRALQAKRQPGSSFKPFLYAAGLETGYSPNSIILDSPEALGGADASLNWKPRNYDGKFRGPMTFRNSLELSRNIPTIKIVQDVGMNYLFKFLNRIKFNAEMPNDLSISLGSFGVTLTDLVAAYSIFPNGGQYIKPKFLISVTDRYGKEYLPEILSDDTEDKDSEIASEDNVDSESTKVEKEQEPKVADTENLEGEEVEEEKINPFLENLDETQVYDKRLSFIMTNLLKGVVQNGSGRRAKSISNFIGGKTGTTNEFVDAWFIGFSQNNVTGVWTGFDDNKTMGYGEAGSKAALPIWKNYMEKSIALLGESDFKVPPGIINVYVDKQTGESADINSPGAILESFVEGTEPGNSEIKSFFKAKNTKKTDDLYEDDDFFNQQ